MDDYGDWTDYYSGDGDWGGNYPTQVDYGIGGVSVDPTEGGRYPQPANTYWNNEVGGWQRGTPNVPQTYAPSPSLALHQQWSSGPSLYSQTTGGFMPQGYGPSQPSRPASGGQYAMSQQTPQQIALGKPEDDLYKRYKSLLMNPDFSGDPTYQFLYNQGLQGLNRNLAAQRMSLSGKSMNDTMAYGAGMASKYMQDLLPQYRGGAQEELNRFMGPAGLLPRYAATNNAAIGQANNMVSNAENRQLLGQMPMGQAFDPSGFTAGGLGWGGISQRAQPQPATQNWPTPQPLSSWKDPDPYGLDQFEEMMGDTGG